LLNCQILYYFLSSLLTLSFCVRLLWFTFTHFNLLNILGKTAQPNGTKLCRDGQLEGEIQICTNQVDNSRGRGYLRAYKGEFM
jgi:hypothetical protein